jgi:hypothetical protein
VLVSCLTQLLHPICGVSPTPSFKADTTSKRASPDTRAAFQDSMVFKGITLLFSKESNNRSGRMISDQRKLRAFTTAYEPTPCIDRLKHIGAPNVELFSCTWGPPRAEREEEMAGGRVTVPILGTEADDRPSHSARRLMGR